MFPWSKKKPAEPTAAQKNANRLARLSFAKGVGAPSSRASTRSSSEPAGSMALLAESPYGSDDEEVGSLTASSSRGAASSGSTGAPALNMYRSPAAFGQRGTMRLGRKTANASAANAAAMAVMGAAVAANAVAPNAVAVNAVAPNAVAVNAVAPNAFVPNAGATVVGGRKSRRNKRRSIKRRSYRHRR